MEIAFQILKFVRCTWFTNPRNLVQINLQTILKVKNNLVPSNITCIKSFQSNINPPQ
jgi:hypothetical protein